MLEKTALLLSAFTTGTALSLNELSERTGLANVHGPQADRPAPPGWVARVGQRYELGMALTRTTDPREFAALFERC